MDTWASLLDKSPLIAIILALAGVVVYLFRSRDKERKEAATAYNALQEKYTADLIKATEAMNNLATENLKQSFSDSAAWRDSVREFADTLKDHMRDEGDNYRALSSAISDVKSQVSSSEASVKQHVSDRLRG